MNEIIEVGDIVTIIAPIEFPGKNGKPNTKMEGLRGMVLFIFTDWQNEKACILDVPGVCQSPFLMSDLKLEEKHQEQESKVNPEPYEVIRVFAKNIPQFSLGYVYQINRRLVAAHSLEEAIGIFRQQYETETIENVKLLEHDNAIIQNEIPVV